MSNITISLSEQLLKESRAYAQAQKTSLNDFIRGLLAKTVKKPGTIWLQDSFALMDKAHGHSHGQTWTREELHS